MTPKRNSTREYLDFAPLADRLNTADCVQAMEPFDRLYLQANGLSMRQQLLTQLSDVMPFNLDEKEPVSYRELASELAGLASVRRTCAKSAQILFDFLFAAPPARPSPKSEAENPEDALEKPDPCGPPPRW